MKPLVEIIQVSDGSWYLQILITDSSDVPIMNTLIPCERYIYAIHTAQSLQLHVDNVRRNYDLDKAI